MSQQILRSVLLCGSFLGNTLRINIWGREGNGKKKREPGLIRGSWVVSRIFSNNLMKSSAAGITPHCNKGTWFLCSCVDCHWMRAAPRKDVEPGVRSCLQLKQFLERDDNWELSAMVIPRGSDPSVLEEYLWSTPQCLVLQVMVRPQSHEFWTEPQCGSSGWEEYIFSRRFYKKNLEISIYIYVCVCVCVCV